MLELHNRVLREFFPIIVESRVDSKLITGRAKVSTSEICMFVGDGPNDSFIKIDILFASWTSSR